MVRLSGWKVPVEHLSTSSIAQLIACPEQWRQRRILKVRETCGPDKFLGIVDHAVHARNFQQKIETNEDLDLVTMSAMYDHVWETEDEDEAPQWGETDESDAMSQGREMMAVYHSGLSPQVHPISVEERFETKIVGVPVPIIGYTDIEEKHKLIERKTTKTRVKDPKPKWRVQGRIYSLTYSKPVEYHVITKQKTPQLITSDIEPGLWLEPGHQDSTVELIQHAAYTLNDLYVRYGPDKPWPQNGLFHDWQCSYCSFGPKHAKTCPAWSEGVMPK